MKKCFILAWLLLPATWLLTGCTDNIETTAPEEKTTGLEPIQMECSKVQQTPFAKQSNKFANKFFATAAKEVEGTNTNLCISPISMQYILSIYANGLADEQAQKVVDFLDMGTLDQVNESSRQLLALFNEDDEYVKVAMVNGLWQQANSKEIIPSFAEKIQTYYLADTKETNFKDPQAAKSMINGWVADKTDGRITDAHLKVGDYTFTQNAWVNATSFDAKWTYPFNALHTKKDSFTNIDGTVSEVDMMEANVGMAFDYSNEDVYIMELPYGKGYYTMMLGIPRKAEKLDSICANTDWWAVHEQAHLAQLELYMPRFSISTDLTTIFKNEENSATGILSKLGLDESVAYADMVKATKPARQMWGLSQTAIIEVEENGTKAVTSTSGNDGMYISPYAPRRIDKPFFFAIRENTTGTILFMGKVVHL